MDRCTDSSDTIWAPFIENGRGIKKIFKNIVSAEIFTQLSINDRKGPDCQQ